VTLGKLAGKRRLVLSLMLVVSLGAWSAWAIAQDAPAQSTPAQNPPRHRLFHPAIQPPPAGLAPGAQPLPLRPGAQPQSLLQGIRPGAPPPPGVRPGAPGPAGSLRPGRPAPPGPPTPGTRREARHEQAEEAESEHPAPINWTDFSSNTPPFIAMLINFGILAAGYYLLGKKPVAAALQNRRDTIAKDIEDAHKMLGEAQARAQTYQFKLERVGQESETARSALAHAGEAERDRIVSEAEAKAERMRKDAEFQVDQDLKQIRQDLWRETVEAAVGEAEELLRKRVTPADQERMAEDYLAELAGAGTAPAASSEAPGAAS
jgi:F-type H+-transporting ATPase subunit b